MEINCSYCEKCDTLWDDKEVENGLCFDCQEPLIKMVARPVAAQQSFAVDETFCACKDEAFINDETPGCCGNCGKPFRH